MTGRRLAALCAGATLCGTAAAPATATASAMRFSITYAGSGSYRTVYESQPSNPGGRPDHNHADDSSRQRWSLRFTHALTISRCSGAGGVCVSPATLAGARGTTSIAASIDHVHVDGLYAFDDTSARCRLRSSTPAGALLPAQIQVTYRPRTRSVIVTALDPVGRALLLLAPACPGQGDSLDGLLDNYLEPGFSFAAGYGADRWFRSATVALPATRLERAPRLSVLLHDTRAGAPPRRCAVEHPSWQECRTGGSWRGTLTLRRVAASADQHEG